MELGLDLPHHFLLTQDTPSPDCIESHHAYSSDAPAEAPSRGFAQTEGYA